MSGAQVTPKEWLVGDAVASLSHEKVVAALSLGVTSEGKLPVYDATQALFNFCT